MQQEKGYPNSFAYGVVFGVLLNMTTRIGTYEPLAARPFSYLTAGLVFGVGVWYYDYWRRRAIEEVLYADERRRYHMQLKAVNRVRIGEEHEIQNLVEYLTNQTVRE